MTVFWSLICGSLLPQTDEEPSEAFELPGDIFHRMYHDSVFCNPAPSLSSTDIRSDGMSPKV